MKSYSLNWLLPPPLSGLAWLCSGGRAEGWLCLPDKSGDHGWFYAHEVSRQQLQAHFDDKIETSYVENVPEGQDAARVIRELAAQGIKVISPPHSAITTRRSSGQRIQGTF